MDKPDANPIKVKFTKGRNMFASAFAELAIVRRQLGSDMALSNWCWNDLRIPLTVLTTWADILDKADAKRVKAEHSMAHMAEQMMKAKEREALASAKAKARSAKQDEIGRLKTEITRLQTEIARLKANGAAHLSAAEKAALAIKANPDKSDRDIAADIGVSHMTVFRARNNMLTRGR